MSAEQVVRSFLSAFETYGPEEASRYLAENMTLRVINPPINEGKAGFVAQGEMILGALPDFKWNVQKLTVQGNRVLVKMRWSGNHEGVFPLSVLMPGAPDLPPTGQRLSVPDTFTFTVDGDRIVTVEIDSGPGEGLLGMLNQLGVQLPPM
jgi:predicted ester cyclase